MKRVAEEEKRRMTDELRCTKDDLANLTSELELANESKKELVGHVLMGLYPFGHIQA